MLFKCLLKVRQPCCVFGEQEGTRKDRGKSMQPAVTASTPTVTFYHGASGADFDGWRPDRGKSDEADMLFLSRSANVARRYGRVYEIEYPVTGIPAISVEDWLNGRIPETTFLILGDGGYDFPVDTLVLREDPATEFHEVTDVEALDDGLAFIHDPVSPDDRQFDDYIAEHYAGDLQAFTADIQHSVSI